MKPSSLGNLSSFLSKGEERLLHLSLNKCIQSFCPHLKGEYWRSDKSRALRGGMKRGGKKRVTMVYFEKLCENDELRLLGEA